MKLYHATFQSYISSIEENGLLPDQQKNWATCTSGFVYLANDKDGAISFCEVAEDIIPEGRQICPLCEQDMKYAPKQFVDLRRGIPAPSVICRIRLWLRGAFGR